MAFAFTCPLYFEYIKTMIILNIDDPKAELMLSEQICDHPRCQQKSPLYKKSGTKRWYCENHTDYLKDNDEQQD